MTEELEVLVEVAKRLDQARIDYMVTGSMAMNYYAQPRMTRDIDIVVNLTSHESLKVIEIFEGDFYISREAVQEAILRRSLFNIIHNKTILKVDLILLKDTDLQRLELQRRLEVDIEGKKIWLTSPEGLILSKLLWARESESEQQLKDIKNLLENVKELDHNYVKSWINELKLHDLFQKATQ